MIGRRAIGAVSALGLSILASGAPARADAPYPDWKGEWLRQGSGSFDPSHPAGLGQQAPLTPEYQAVLEKSLAEQAAGGQGNNTMGECIPPGMPRTMIDYEGMEFIITPQTTYLMLQEPENQVRRIYTDGRRWPEQITPSYLGYSIGQWVDSGHVGKFDTLEVETRAIKGPHSYDSSGMPFHRDAQTVIKERFTTDKANPNVMHDEIATIDHALTRPWVVTRSYQRVKQVIWSEVNCVEDNHQVRLGPESYYVSGDGYLMPTRAGQPAPDLRYFDQGRK